MMSPPQLIPPASPVQVFAGTEDPGGNFRDTGHGPFRALIVSSLRAQVIAINHSKLSGIKSGDTLPDSIPLNRIETSNLSNKYGCTEWPRQDPPPHLMRETISGRTGGVLTCLTKYPYALLFSPRNDMIGM